MRNITVLLLITGLVSFSSCKKKKDDDTTPKPSSFNLEVLLSNWSGGYIIPAYEDYVAKTVDLKQKVAAFLDKPDAANLSAARVSLDAAYLSWQGVSFLEVGPASDITLRSETNIYPTDTAKLNAAIKAADNRLSGADKLALKGLPAVDYLLNDGSDDEVIKQYGVGGHGSSRKVFLKTVVDKINSNAELVLRKWDPNNGDYANQFNSAVGNDVGSSIGLMLNALNQHIERNLRDGKLGIPNGNRNFSGTPLPQNVEAFYQGKNSVNLALANLKAIESIYLGKTFTGEDKVGLEEYLVSLGAKHSSGTLNDAIKAQLKTCEEKIKAIPSPLKSAVSGGNASVDEAVKALQQLIVLTKADVPSATGILITYQDNDGD